MTPPIRFLVAVVGGWTAVRIVMLLPAFDAPSVSAKAPPVATKIEEALAPAKLELVDLRPSAEYVALPLLLRSSNHAATVRQSIIVQAKTGTAPPTPLTSASVGFTRRVKDAPRRRLFTPSFAGVFLPVPASPTSRWSGSAWALVRGRGEPTEISDGVLGASQAGARVLYRVNGRLDAPLSLSGRLSSPLERSGVEAALGVEWQPVAGLPVRLLAERRQRVSGDGRSAFALLGHGGVSDVEVRAGFRLDAYAQAGIVGARSHDLFADAGATLVKPLLGTVPGNLAIGLGAWGGAQPGLARLDLGPRATTTFGVTRVSLDWRFRVAGDAAPKSGPSLTVGTGF